jgi:hypothetical protein
MYHCLLFVSNSMLIQGYGTESGDRYSYRTGAKFTVKTNLNKILEWFMRLEMENDVTKVKYPKINSHELISIEYKRSSKVYVQDVEQ